MKVGCATARSTADSVRKIARRRCACRTVLPRDFAHPSVTGRPRSSLFATFSSPDTRFCTGSAQRRAGAAATRWGSKGQVVPIYGCVVISYKGVHGLTLVLVPGEGTSLGKAGVDTRPKALNCLLSDYVHRLA